MTLADDKFSMTGEEDLGKLYKVKVDSFDDLVPIANSLLLSFQMDESVIYKIEYEHIEKVETKYYYVCRIRKFERFKHVDSRELREHYQQKKLK